MISSSPIRVLQTAWHATLIEGLTGIIDQIKRYNPDRIILFGSMATGKITTQSDLDLLVIMPSDRRGKEWMRIIGDELERPVPVDLLVFTSEELEEYLPKSTFLREIIGKGKVIYDKRCRV